MVCVVCSAVRFGLRQIFLINQYRRQEILRIEREFTEKTGIDSHYEMDPGLNSSFNSFG